MTEIKIVHNASDTNDLVITRVFDAPRQLVWRAFTEEERLKRWWGPQHFTAPVCQVDLRVGGKYLFCMRSPDGKDYWTTGAYREIVPFERIVYTDSFADEQGNVVPASHYGMGEGFPLEMQVTWKFEDTADGKTKFTLIHAGMIPGEMTSSSAEGWNSSFDKLAEHALTKTLFTAEPGTQEFSLVHELDAPRELVFSAHVDPNLYFQWLGPRELTTTVEQFEPRAGGSYRFFQKDPSGNTFSFHGVYHEVKAPERIIATFEFEGLPEAGHPSLDLTLFEELPGDRTRLVARSIFLSVADRDGMVQAMSEGGGEIDFYSRLEELLASLVPVK